jgi:hypothetical protein
MAGSAQASRFCAALLAESGNEIALPRKESGATTA